jgi:hypothetical protein
LNLKQRVNRAPYIFDQVRIIFSYTLSFSKSREVVPGHTEIIRECNNLGAGNPVRFISLIPSLSIFLE